MFSTDTPRSCATISAAKDCHLIRIQATGIIKIKFYNIYETKKVDLTPIKK